MRLSRTSSLIILLLASAGLLNGCSTINETLDNDKVAYKSIRTNKQRTLDVPPDLTQVQADTRYAVPDSGTASLSAFNANPGGTSTTSSAATVAPITSEDVRLERAGNQRWLVVKADPETLYPKIKKFWEDSGLIIVTEEPKLGIMETDWAENRAKLPQDVVRRTIGRLFDSLYSTGERDRYRTRLERAENGQTEIFVSHRGMIEVVEGAQKERTVWQPRPSDPELEAEFLSRLMVVLGGEQVQAKAKAATATPDRARLLNGAEGNFVEVDENFDRAWRRIGLALDRTGFTVEDRDRSQGVYYVRYIAPNPDLQGDKKDEKGFFGRLFSRSGSDKDIKDGGKYRVEVKSGGEKTRVAVIPLAGAEKAKAVSNEGQILSILQQQLK